MSNPDSGTALEGFRGAVMDAEFYEGCLGAWLQGSDHPTPLNSDDARPQYVANYANFDEYDGAKIGEPVQNTNSVTYGPADAVSLPLTGDQAAGDAHAVTMIMIGNFVNTLSAGMGNYAGVAVHGFGMGVGNALFQCWSNQATGGQIAASVSAAGRGTGFEMLIAMIDATSIVIGRIRKNSDPLWSSAVTTLPPGGPGTILLGRQRAALINPAHMAFFGLWRGKKAQPWGLNFFDDQRPRLEALPHPLPFITG